VGLRTEMADMGTASEAHALMVWNADSAI